MALEDIFKALEHQAERDITDVLAEARARAAGIVSEAEIEASNIRERHAAEAETTAAARTMQSLNSSRLEARRKLAGVRQDTVGSALDRARSELGGTRDSDGYEVLFTRLLDEALEGVEGEYEILVDPLDLALAQKALSARGIDASIKPELSTVGGVVVAMNGGRILRRNTLEDRFEKYVGFAQADVAEILFS
jgi:vacuolar-type H+-ATPase subunit E/Vma4